ncbi:hypothetical protein [Stenomitos frigidus]|nr:hypothetical protein [Stenomitos frigidus]
MSDIVAVRNAIVPISNRIIAILSAIAPTLGKHDESDIDRNRVSL